MGAMVNELPMKKSLDCIAYAMAKGATITTGGRRVGAEPLKTGHFVKSTVHSGATLSMRVAREEILGSSGSRSGGKPRRRRTSSSMSLSGMPPRSSSMMNGCLRPLGPLQGPVSPRVSQPWRVDGRNPVSFHERRAYAWRPTPLRCCS
ncbi:aldehyde dehydrogenase family protein [Variovorax sp. J31P207]|uniref:aldehyde dehydrogenase family protein n=1 Tax=Variovorax sp. J31P207 TaxID=3053510 RepID=UPI00336581DB